MTRTGNLPDATTDHVQVTNEQSRITNGAGIMMVRTAAGRWRRVARAAIRDARFSPMVVCRGA